MALRAGLLGFGSMGRHHARVLASLEDVQLVAIADAANDKHDPLADPVFVNDVSELINVGLDYCVVATPTLFHEEAAVQLAAAGIPTLIEKPLSIDVASAERVVDAFRDNGVIGAVGHIERYNPALQECRTRIANGELGEIYQIATRRQGPFPPRITDVGVVMDLATHDIDLTSWVAQEAFASVSARCSHKSGRNHEDLVAVTGMLQSGIVTNHLVNWLSPLKERTTIVTGERGTFVADTLTADLTFYANGRIATEWDRVASFRGISEGDVTRYAIAKPEPLRTEHEAFRQSVLLGIETGIVTLEQGLNTVRVAAAVIRSAIEGTSIDLTSAGRVV